MRRVTIFSSFLIGSLASTAASAQSEAAAAQALFDEGRALMDAQRYSEACPKLAESQRLDPGIGTQFHLANCYERQGKVASAWAVFLEVASIARGARQPEREKAALARAARLEPRLPRLKIVVPPENQLEGLEVRRDGSVVSSAQWQSALPVDPGSHEITASAPGQKPFAQTVVTNEAAQLTVEIPLLQVDSSAAQPLAPATTKAPAGAAPIVPDGPPATPPEPPSASTGGPGPLVIVLGAVGVAGLGLGTALAVMARGKNEDSKDYCNPNDENRCQQKGVELRDDARSLGTGATIAFAAGGAALVTAGIVWLTGSKPEHQATRRGITGADLSGTGLLVKGQF